MSANNDAIKNIESAFKGASNEDYTYRISHKNINQLKFPFPQKFGTILFDSNLNCNLHCIYCHNHRDNNTVSEDDFAKFIETQVESVKNFQIGCAMEPLMDKRMTKFALMVSKSKAKPYGYFRLQTNGILLHKHKVEDMKEAGISKITISIDTMDPEVHKVLRGGSDLRKILNNITKFKEEWPESRVQFITTVNSLNINDLGNLCDYAIGNGIASIELRKMFYRPESNVIIEHDKMKGMVLTDAEFDTKTSDLVEKYKGRMEFYVNGTQQLEKHRSKEKV